MIIIWDQVKGVCKSLTAVLYMSSKKLDLNLVNCGNHVQTYQIASES